MKISKAVITAAGRKQRTLPMQTLIDRDGVEKSVLRILVEEVVAAGIEEICVVIVPGDEKAYAEVVGEHAGRLHFAQQSEPLGHGHAVLCAQNFVENQPFLHLVGDHLYVSHGDKSCAQRLVEVAEHEECAVSAVQATRESLLPYYGTIGGRRVSGKPNLYRIESVIEKPTPTEAEQHLIVPGLRAGSYLCFFGMHILTPTVLDILQEMLGRLQTAGGNGLTLASALAELSRREQYLALEQQDSRYDIGVKYGLLTAQLALALSGQERTEVLTRLVDLMAQRELRDA